MSICTLRDTLAVEGPDAAKYLQGQLSNDVAGLETGSSCWSFLLEPTGKLGFLLRVRREAAESFVLDMEHGTGAAVEVRLRRFLIRTKATLSAGSEMVDIEGRGDGVELVGWWDEGCHRVQPATADVGDEYESCRIAAGWPGPAELIEGLIPGETGLVPVAASFTKGCYTGQELVARIDSRGNNVPKLLHRVELTAPAGPGAEITVDGTVVGTVTSVDGLHALGYVHRNVTAPADALVDGSSAQLASLR